MLTYTLVFLAGGLTFTAALMLAAWVIYKRDKKKLDALQAAEQKRLEEEKAAYDQQLEEARVLLTEVIKGTKTIPTAGDTVKERLRNAMDLASKQIRINPKQSTDSQEQWNELELKKLDLLRAILADGYDPVITIRYNTGDQEMQLSTYVASIQKGLA